MLQMCNDVEITVELYWIFARRVLEGEPPADVQSREPRICGG